ncbi:hypothetical protein BS17DRAFT_787820 [Gyrodon lividus]|nr:hypothetical protein BS17DRAFT_787820 [Gyrodon lividus]
MKSAHTLCAYHWLKQVNEDGMAAQFNEYWKHLKKDQKAKYEKDSGTLNNSDTIINTLSSGMVY